MAEVGCPNGCGAKLRTARGLEVHLKKKCKYRPDKDSKLKNGVRKFRVQRRHRD